MVVYGWDASDFDWDRGPMDLASARAAGIDFFTHKATEGTSTRHRRYGEALRRARDAGVPVLGAYGIPRSGQGSDAAQVDYFLAYVTAQTPWWETWPHWMFQVDLEHWSYDAVGPGHGVAWCERLAKLTGRRVVLYAPQWAYGDTIGGDWPLWASNYGANPVGSYRSVYPGDGSPRWARYSGRTPVILQYGSRTVIGRQGTCDANAFRGDLAALLQFVGGPADSAGPSKGDEQMIKTFAVDQGAGHVAYYGVFNGFLVSLPDGGRLAEWRAMADQAMRGGEVNVSAKAFAEIMETARASAEQEPPRVEVTADQAAALGNQVLAGIGPLLHTAVAAAVDERVEAALRRVLGGLDGASPTGG